MRRGIAACQGEEGHGEARSGIAIARLDEKVGGRQRRDLRQCDAEVIAVDDGERPLARHDAVDAG